MSSVWDWSLLQTIMITRQSAYLNLSSSAILIHPSWLVAPAPFCAILEHYKYRKWTKSNVVHSTEKKNNKSTQSFCYHTYCCHPIVYFQTVRWWTKRFLVFLQGEELYVYSINTTWAGLSEGLRSMFSLRRAVQHALNREILTHQVRMMSKASFLRRVLNCFLLGRGWKTPNKQTENGNVPTICKSFVFTLCFNLITAFEE